MSSNYFIETLPNGSKQFVHLRRSRSHHDDHYHHRRHHYHHHHDDEKHHHRHENCADVTKAEWDALVKRERQLRADNETLKHENHGLKHDNQGLIARAQADEVEIRRLQGWIAPLQQSNAALRAENESLRRSLDAAGEHAVAHHHEVEKLARKIRRLERENETLVARVRELTRRCTESVAGKVAELRDAVHAWQRRCEEAEARVLGLRRENGELAGVVAEQRERLGVYERILRRHGWLS